MRLVDKVAIVTGGTRGIGRAIAERFAQEGADLVLLDIDLESSHEVVETIERLGRRAIAAKANVSCFGEVSDAVRQAVDMFGHIDILVNCAGTGTAKILLPDVSEEDWDRVIGTNLKGCFICSQLVARQMIAQHTGGKIVNIGSISAEESFAGQLPYATSKGGLHAMTRAAAVDLARYHINVNAIAPGSVDTVLLRRFASPGEYEKRTARIPLKRMAQPDDVAGSAVFLASSDANHVTGSLLIVDGGETIARIYE